MKIIISSKSKEKEDLMDSRFGRCPYFYIYNSETKKGKMIENEAANTGGGAGIKAANFIIEEKPDILITGNLGPNAENVLRESNIEVILMKTKPILEILKDY